MSVDDSEEFKDALRKACEEKYDEWLFGSKAKVKEAEKLPPEVLKALKEAERVKREGEALKRRAENQMRGMSSMGGFGWKSPTLPNLSANPSMEEIEGYRAEVEAYAEQMRSDAQRLSDETMQRGLKNYNEKHPSAQTGLHCPECGDPDNGNLMNKTPWCIKCNVALVKDGEKIKKQPKIKAVDKSRVPNILRGLPDT